MKIFYCKKRKFFFLPWKISYSTDRPEVVWIWVSINDNKGFIPKTNTHSLGCKLSALPKQDSPRQFQDVFMHIIVKGLRILSGQVVSSKKVGA